MAITFLKCSFCVPAGSKKELIHSLKNFGETFQGRSNGVLKWRPWDIPKTRILNIQYKPHYCWVFFFILFQQMCCVKYCKVSCYVYSYSFGKTSNGCSQNVLKRCPWGDVVRVFPRCQFWMSRTNAFSLKCLLLYTILGNRPKDVLKTS